MKAVVTAFAATLVAGSVLAGDLGEKAAATQAVVAYMTAVSNGDPRGAANYCHEPLTYISAGMMDMFDSRGDIEILLRSAIDGLKRRGWARSKVPQLNVKVVSGGLAIASALVIREKTNGDELEREGVTYFLRKGRDGWRVAVIAPHEPANVLKLE